MAEITFRGNPIHTSGDLPPWALRHRPSPSPGATSAR